MKLPSLGICLPLPDHVDRNSTCLPEPRAIGAVAGKRLAFAPRLLAIPGRRSDRIRLRQFLAHCFSLQQNRNG